MPYTPPHSLNEINCQNYTNTFFFLYPFPISKSHLFIHSPLGSVLEFSIGHSYEVCSDAQGGVGGEASQTIVVIIDLVDSGIVGLRACLPAVCVLVSEEAVTPDCEVPCVCILGYKRRVWRGKPRGGEPEWIDPHILPPSRGLMVAGECDPTRGSGIVFSEDEGL